MRRPSPASISATAKARRIDTNAMTYSNWDKLLPPPNGSAFSGVQRPSTQALNAWIHAILPRRGTAQREHVRCKGLGGGQSTTSLVGSHLPRAMGFAVFWKLVEDLEREA